MGSKKAFVSFILSSVVSFISFSQGLAVTSRGTVVYLNGDGTWSPLDLVSQYVKTPNGNTFVLKQDGTWIRLNEMDSEFADMILMSKTSGNEDHGEQANIPIETSVCLLTDASGVDDMSYNAAAWRGILSFYGESSNSSNTANKGKLYNIVATQTEAMYVPNLKLVSDRRYSLVMVTGFTWADTLDLVAPTYPDQKYMIVDVDWVQASNVMQITFSEHEGSYLVGVAAALKAKADDIKDPKFGFIGGVPGPVITKFEMGWVQGILSVLPQAKILDYYANDWGRPELAKAQAKNWYDSGVYAIFSAAGGTGNGTIAQAKEYRAQGKNVWAIGVDSDQFQDGIYAADGKSAILTSMIKRVESASAYALRQVKAGTFKGEIVVLSAKDDGVDYSRANPELSKDIVAKVDAVKTMIIDGSVKVIPTYAEAKAAGMVPGNLQARD